MPEHVYLTPVPNSMSGPSQARSEGVRLVLSNSPQSPAVHVYMQWSNYEGARGGLVPLRDRVAPSKHLV